MNFKKHYSSLLALYLVGIIIFYYTREITVIMVFTAVILIGFLWEKFGILLENIWLKFSHIMGLFMPKVILSIIFFFLLTPIALLAKVFQKKDLLNLKNTKESLWESDNTEFSKDFFKKMW